MERSVMKTGGMRASLVVGALAAFTVALNSGAASEGPPPPLGTWSKPMFGSTPGLARPLVPRSFLEETEATTGVHMSLRGKPCVTVAASTRPEPVNTKTYYHLVLASNDCGERITIQVCYYQSQVCVLIQLPSFSRKEAMLGIMPANKDFRYEYREQVERRPGGLQLRPN